ncbi:MAG: hypothetical protein ACXVCY_04530 [Pseudobdellovibrionaceae bacterium]
MRVDKYAFNNVQVVKQTSNELGAQLARRFRDFITPVLGYRAMHKLESLVYDQAGEKDRRVSSTGFGYFTQTRFGGTNFFFILFHRDVKAPDGRRLDIAIHIEEKSIPAIYKGLNTYIRQAEKIRELKTFQDCYGLDQYIQRNFCGEYTVQEFKTLLHNFARHLRDVALDMEAMAAIAKPQQLTDFFPEKQKYVH